MSVILRATFTVDYEVHGRLPSPSDEEASEILVHCLLETGHEGTITIESWSLEPVGWRVDAGPYGDLGAGLAPDRPNGPRSSSSPASTQRETQP